MGIPATMVMPTLTVGQYDLIYNMTSLGLASMGASTVFFFLRLSSFKEEYRAALCFTGLVTFIACYHYFRIFDSFNTAYTPCKVEDGTVDYNTVVLRHTATPQLALLSTTHTDMLTGSLPSLCSSSRSSSSCASLRLRPSNAAGSSASSLAS